MKKLIFAIAVVCAACVGYMVARVEYTNKDRSQSNTTEKSEAGTSDELIKARKKIAELEKKLKAQVANVKIANKEKGVAVKDSGNTNRIEVIMGGDDDLVSNLKRQLPEAEFAKATNAISAMTAKLSALSKGRVDYLESIDTSRMTKAERDNHIKYIEMLKKKDAISANFKNGIPNMKSIEEMAMLDFKLQPIAKMERSVLVREVGRELGYKKEEIDVFHDTMNAVFDCTNPGGMGDVMELVGDQQGVNVETQVIGL